MSKNKEPRGLGRGLDAILSSGSDLEGIRKPIGYVNKEIVGNRADSPVNAQSSITADIVRIPIGMLEPNPFQPRLSFDQDALEELAGSIRTLGLIQPITVRRSGTDKYQIISGERRYRACRLAGLDTVPAYIRDASEQGMMEMAIVENIQREDLDPIEVAMSYQRLIEECHLTQEQMAGRVGKKRATVANYLRLLNLPAKIQHDLKVDLISVGHAKVLLGIEDSALQEKLCDLIVKEGLSVRQLEERIKKLSAAPKQEEAQDLPDQYYQLLERMGKYFGDNISLRRSASGKGSMTVRFSSDEEMARFLQALGDAQN